MKKICLLALVMFIADLSFGQKTTLELTPFDKLDIFGPFKVKLIKSETASVEVDFNGVEKDDIVAEIDRGTLRLKLKLHYVSDQQNGKPKYVLVKVYYKDIDVIDASAGAIVSSNEQLKSKYLSIDCTMGAEIKLNVLAKKIEAIARMGGELKLEGATEYLEVRANMGGILEARNLKSKSIYVKANMGAEVMVNATEEIEASAGFGASVDYIGGPSVRRTSKNFGGEVHRRDIE